MNSTISPANQGRTPSTDSQPIITTVPAMVLATRQVPGLPVLDWFRLTAWTLICGTLAAGSANAINQYLDRDIDARMARTRRRPLPAHEVEPERAMLFCRAQLLGLYGKLGFAEIRAAVWAEQPAGRIQMPMPAMWRGLRAGASWPPGRAS